MSLDRAAVLRLVGAAMLAVSAGVHLRLYRDGYRDIHADRLLGIDLSRSFLLSVVAGVLLASALVAAVALGRAVRPLDLAGAAYAAGALVAYALSRTTGFLGYEEDRWVAEAVAVKPVEVVALVALLLAATTRATTRTRPATG